MIVDYYSRYYEVVVMHSTTSEKIVTALNDIFARFGYPHSLKWDNGRQFVSEEFQRFLQEANIEHRTSPPLWPQANGEVERQNRTLLKTLKVAQAEGKDWRREFPPFFPNFFLHIGRHHKRQRGERQHFLCLNGNWGVSCRS